MTCLFIKLTFLASVKNYTKASLWFYSAPDKHIENKSAQSVCTDIKGVLFIKKKKRRSKKSKWEKVQRFLGALLEIMLRSGKIFNLQPWDTRPKVRRRDWILWRRNITVKDPMGQDHYNVKIIIWIVSKVDPLLLIRKTVIKWEINQQLFIWIYK